MKNLVIYGLLAMSLTPLAMAQSFELLGSTSFVTGHQFQNEQFGGISAITKTDSDGRYIGLSDAKGDKNGQPRIYMLDVDFDGELSVELRDMIELKDQGERRYDNDERDGEGVAYWGDDSVLWVSERTHMMEQHDINTGLLRQDYTDMIPEYYRGDNETFGLRANQSFEGLSITPDGKTLFVATEAALIQDGSVATPEKPTAARILKYAIGDAQQLTLQAEYLYVTERIRHTSEYGIHDNGISDILALDDETLIVIERNGYSVQEGFTHFDFDIRLYQAKLTEATNIKGHASLKELDVPLPTLPADKQLLLKLADHIEVQDNVESIEFGPKVDGQRTFLLATDNNYQPHQATKFYLFAYRQSGE